MGGELGFHRHVEGVLQRLVSGKGNSAVRCSAKKDEESLERFQAFLFLSRGSGRDVGEQWSVRMVSGPPPCATTPLQPQTLKPFDHLTLSHPHNVNPSHFHSSVSQSHTLHPHILQNHTLTPSEFAPGAPEAGHATKQEHGVIRNPTPEAPNPNTKAGDVFAAGAVAAWSGEAGPGQSHCLYLSPFLSLALSLSTVLTIHSKTACPPLHPAQSCSTLQSTMHPAPCTLHPALHTLQEAKPVSQ